MSLGSHISSPLASDREHDRQVSGRRLQAPMLKLHRSSTAIIHQNYEVASTLALSHNARDTDTEC